MFNDAAHFDDQAAAGHDTPDHDAAGAPARTGVDSALPTLMTLYLREVRRYARLAPEQEQVLVAHIDSGDARARDALICHHLGLVISMARGFANRGLELLDLIEEGNLGMLVALQKFESGRGVRFSTYAAWWIRYYLQTAIATQVPIVRPPLRAQQRAARQAWQQWCDSHDAACDDSAGAAIAPSALVTAVSFDDADTEAQLQQAGLVHGDPLDELAERRDTPRTAALLHALVERLPPRERDIIVARFGLDGRDECTLQELSHGRGVTRERIRQLQAAALQALRLALEDLGVTREVALQ